MAIEAITQALATQVEAAQPAREASAGYDAGFADGAQFDRALGKSTASASSATDAGGAGLAHLLESGPLGTMLNPLQRINQDAQKLSGHTAGNTMMPSEMMTLTIRSHEFLFHCELTANVANRTSDGIQQLFRQQS